MQFPTENAKAQPGNQLGLRIRMSWCIGATVEPGSTQHGAEKVRPQTPALVVTRIVVVLPITPVLVTQRGRIESPPLLLPVGEILVKEREKAVVMTPLYEV